MKYAVPFVQELLPGIKGNLISAVIILTLVSPFLRAIIIKKNRSYEFLKLWKENKSNHGPLIFTIIFRAIMCAGLIMFVLYSLFKTNFVIAFALAIVILILFTASKHLKMRSLSIENRFRENLNEKEKYTESKAPLTRGFLNHVLERDLHLSEFVIQPYFSIVGKTLKELNFRQFFGVNVVTIVRGQQRINIPNGNERIYPNDHIVVLGTDKQVELFQMRLEEKRKKYQQLEENPTPEVKMMQIQICPESQLIGKTIRNSGIHDEFGCLVIGVERNDFSIQDLDLELEKDDIVWLIGEYDNIIKISKL
jgi:CPA2 family monovalent cation:H+ antiporter-2